MTSEQGAQGPHQVLYRKWRPQTLEQVVGQEHITRTLLNALEREQGRPRLSVHRPARDG